MAYTEALEDAKAVTTIGSFCRIRTFFAMDSTRTDRVITDIRNNDQAGNFTQSRKSADADSTP